MDDFCKGKKTNKLQRETKKNRFGDIDFNFFL